jgi:hypothetical protein
VVEHTPRQRRQRPKVEDAPCHRRRPGQLSPQEIAWQREVAASPIGDGDEEALVGGDSPAASLVDFGVVDLGAGAPVVEIDLPADVREVGQGALVLGDNVLGRGTQGTRSLALRMS